MVVRRIIRTLSFFLENRYTEQDDARGANEMEIKNVAAMEALGEAIGRAAHPSDNLILTGDLGAGKTTLAKGIARGLGIGQMIKSPTYTIIREYQQGRIPLYHMDVYRITQGADDLGLDDYFEGDGLSVIEWGNQLAEFKPLDYLELTITKTTTETRSVTLTAFGEQAEAFKKRIQQEVTR